MGRVVVTGVAGRIGSHLARALVARGDEVVGVDDLSTGDRRNLGPLLDHPGFTLVEQDVLDRHAMESACAGAETIVHLAARAAPGLGGTLELLDVNARGTEIALACAAREHARFVFASSGLAAREDDDLVLGDPQLRSWSTAASKVYGEHLCFGYAEKHGLSITILRYAGVYGPSFGRPSAIDRRINAAWTLLHVEDAVRATLLAAASLEAVGQVLNVCGAEAITRAELDRLAPALDPGPEIDAGFGALDGSKARTLLGFAPQVDLEDGLTRQVRWLRENP